MDLILKLNALRNVALAGVFAGLGATPEEADLCQEMIGAEPVGDSTGAVISQCAAALNRLRDQARHHGGS